MYALTECQIYTGLAIRRDHAIVIDGDRIVTICPEADLPADLPIQRLQGAIVAPGFIDLQLNGCGGVQFNERLENLTIATLEKMQETNLISGCTSYLPTLITASDEMIMHAVATQRAYLKMHSHQALGLHIEGPYINPKRKGIHDPSLIRSPDPKMIDFLCQNSDVIQMITLAPECVDAEMIRALVHSGITVSMGHSDATYEEARTGFDAGIRMATHLYNAMSQTTGRAPNAVGAIHDEAEVYCGVIADGLHVDWANLRNSHRIKGNKMVLVTDASAPTGTDLSQFTFGGKTIYHRDGRCFGEDGTLAGSALTMIEAVNNALHWMQLPLDEVFRMATLYPAKAIGYGDQLGLIAPGYIANLVICRIDASQQLHVEKTIVNGCESFSRIA